MMRTLEHNVQLGQYEAFQVYYRGYLYLNKTFISYSDQLRLHPFQYDDENDILLDIQQND